MKNWKGRLLIILAMAAMLLLVAAPAMASNDPFLLGSDVLLEDLNDDDVGDGIGDGESFFLRDPETGELNFCTTRVNRLGHERLDCDPVFDR